MFRPHINEPLPKRLKFSEPLKRQTLKDLIALQTMLNIYKFFI